jgi:hypothetical protein
MRDFLCLPFPFHTIRIVSVRVNVLRGRKKFDISLSENRIEDANKEINTELDVWASKPNHIYLARDGILFRCESDWVSTHPLANIYKPFTEKNPQSQASIELDETVQNHQQKGARKRGKRERSKSPRPPNLLADTKSHASREVSLGLSGKLNPKKQQKK